MVWYTSWTRNDRVCTKRAYLTTGPFGDLSSLVVCPSTGTKTKVTLEEAQKDLDSLPPDTVTTHEKSHAAATMDIFNLPTPLKWQFGIRRQLPSE
jgi:hypothetical protein